MVGVPVEVAVMIALRCVAFVKGHENNESIVHPIPNNLSIADAVRAGSNTVPSQCMTCPSNNDALQEL